MLVGRFQADLYWVATLYLESSNFRSLKEIITYFFFPVLSCNFQHVSITRLDTPRNILGHVKLLVLYAPAFSGSAVCTTDFAIEHRETALGKGLKLVCYRESTNWDEAGGICQRKTFLLLGLLMGSAIRFEDVGRILNIAVQCTVHSRFSLTFVEGWHVTGGMATPWSPPAFRRGWERRPPLNQPCFLRNSRDAVRVSWSFLRYYF